MRRILPFSALLLSFPLYAHAQSAAPVEPFSYGQRLGTSSNPLYALASSIIPSAQAGTTQAASPVELFSYGRRIGTQSNPLSIICTSCGQTQSQTDARYLQLNDSNSQTVQGVTEFTNAPQSGSYVIWGPQAYFYVGATKTWTIGVQSTHPTSFSIGYTTWATLQQYATPGTPGDAWKCADCTLTNGNTTVTGVSLWWNPKYGSNGGWDYDARVMGATFGHP